MIETVVIPLLKIAVLLNAILVSVTFMTLLERKVIAWAQSRLGPMRVGPYGVLQAIADPIKLILKEDITPIKADRMMFTLAPIMSLVPALVVFAVVPFGGDELFYITDINVGLLFIISVTSIGVYGIILRRDDDLGQRYSYGWNPQYGGDRRGPAGSRPLVRLCATGGLCARIDRRFG